MRYLKRSAWTSAAKGFPKYPSRRIVPSQVYAMHPHYPGAGNFTAANDSKAQTAARLRGYRSFHVKSRLRGGRGWADIGYCWAIDQQGRVWEAAGDTYAAAHSATPTRPRENHVSVGVLFILGNNERPSSAMLDAGARLYAWLLGRYPNMKTITGHGSIPGAQTECPGAGIRAAIAANAFRRRPEPPTPSKPRPVRDGRTRRVPHTDVKVTVDGDLGQWTITALQTVLRHAGQRGHAVDGDLGSYTVKSLQAFLRGKGYPGHAVDGDLGEYTVRSLQQYLRALGYRGHAVDGDLGEYTVKALQQALIDGLLS